MEGCFLGNMIWLVAFLSLLTVTVHSTDPCIVKYAVTGVPYSVALGFSSVIISAIRTQIPQLFDGIEDHHIYNVSLFDYEGSMGAIVILDPSTPNITAALSEVKKFVEDGEAIDAGGFKLHTIPDSYHSTCPTTPPPTEANVYSTNVATTMQHDTTDASITATGHTDYTAATEETDTPTESGNIGLPSTALMSMALATALALKR